jgi:pyruvate/2-oxoglutarate dehydrogenase complex dihydrolipoamide dehydrogenase (E3) component
VDFDLIVIGGGAAGISAARTALRRRARVAMVQAGPVGGDCTFVGCVPSKTLIEAAAEGCAFETAMSRVHAAVATIAARETATLLRQEGVAVLEGVGRVVSTQCVEVDGRRATARRMVIAAGAVPVVPPIPGLDGLAVLTNENVFDLTERPPSLVVIGGGAVGVELAQAFARLRTAVTLVEAADRVLPVEEPEASDAVARALAAAGVTVLTGRKVTAARAVGAKACIGLADGTEVTASRVLVAVGRRPATTGLGLDTAGVTLDERGFVRTDDHLRTTARNIWASGDVVGRMQFTHAADEMGRIAAANALSKTGRRSYREDCIPAVTFTSPEVASIGMREAAVAATGGGRVAYLPMTDVDRAVTAGRTEGFVKLVARPRRLTGNAAGGRLLGATIVAARAGEMIHEPALAMRARLGPGLLALATHAYPTWSVAVRQAAAQLFFEVGGRQAYPAGGEA